MPNNKKKPVTPAQESTHASRYLFHVTIAILLVVITGIGWFLLASSPAPLNAPPVNSPVAAPAKPQPVAVTPAMMVDEQQCQSCHSEQVKDWQGSHHQLAM